MIDTPTRRLQALGWTLLGLALLTTIYFLSPVLTPFMLAGILGYLLAPGVDWLEQHRCPRWAAVMVMMAGLLLILLILVLILVPLVQHELTQVVSQLPNWLEKTRKTFGPQLKRWFGLEIAIDSATLGKLTQDFLAGHQDMAGVALSYVKTGGGAMLAFFTNLFLTPFVLFYLLLDWHPLLDRLDRAVPRRWHLKVRDMAGEIDGLMSQFLRGQLLVMLILAVLYSGGLAIAGFDSALPVGTLTGLLVFVPYLGFALGLMLALLSAMLQFDGYYGIVSVAIVYGIGQCVESFYLTPHLVGERLGLHPLAVLFALLVFGEVFGFFGVLLALPASAILLVGLRRVRRSYLSSDFYRQNP